MTNKTCYWDLLGSGKYENLQNLIDILLIDVQNNLHILMCKKGYSTCISQMILNNKTCLTNDLQFLIKSHSLMWLQACLAAHLFVSQHQQKKLSCGNIKFRCVSHKPGCKVFPC